MIVLRRLLEVLTILNVATCFVGRNFAGVTLKIAFGSPLVVLESGTSELMAIAG